MVPRGSSKTSVQERIHFGIGKCSLGWVLAASSEIGVCAIFFHDRPNLLVAELQKKFPHARLVADGEDHLSPLTEVTQFLELGTERLDLPLDLGGTAFQQRVWLTLRDIPAGSTASYTDVAKRIDSPRAIRAVAAACAANAIAVAIPCHRVVGRDGRLSGYRWGLDRKRFLLER